MVLKAAETRRVLLDSYITLVRGGEPASRKEMIVTTGKPAWTHDELLDGDARMSHQRDRPLLHEHDSLVSLFDCTQFLSFSARSPAGRESD